MEPASTQPTILIIFGATGDLAQRKLLPALFHLYSNGYLPEHFHIVGFAKTEQSTDAYRNFVRDSIQKKGKARPQELDEFLKLISYYTGQFEDASAYPQLAEAMQRLDDEDFGVCSNKLFYLAVPPNYYDTIFENLSSSGLTIPCGGEEGWTRVLVEKPFGRDLATAQALDQKLGALFQEEQIFRIDHYLAKETVQNIISFRFANALFEPVWNHEYINHISIRVWETLGIGERASFYEDIGALRDVGQNHLLQMLALITMEDPKVLDAQAVRAARAAVLEELEPVSTKNLAQTAVRGQYHGYRQEAGSADSQVETYFRLTARINNDRWRGVPLILESGKKMSENKAEITIVFDEKPSCVCPPDDNQDHQNVLTFRIQPDEGISLLFWTKKPGLTLELEPKQLSFVYNDSDVELTLPDAYEKVLYDCIRGDQTLFASTAEVAAAWHFITPILENWHGTPLHPYNEGSNGPLKVS